MSKAIVTATPATLELDELGSIAADWVVGDKVETRSKMLSRTRDWTANIVVWECGAGSYKWHYNQDEVIIVISGGDRTQTMDLRKDAELLGAARSLRKPFELSELVRAVDELLGESRPRT